MSRGLGTVDIEAENVWEAAAKFDSGEYDSEFIPNGKIGNESAYNAQIIEKAGE